jgi:predicted enzyme related to lactoylglutathione lyase
MISGIHAVVFSPAAEEVRAFFRDILAWPNVDAGEGWLIFALPPAELAVHPASESRQELYLLCEDLDATVAALEAKGVGLARPIREVAWGRLTAIILPGGTEIALYQPTHPRPVRP